MKKSILLLAIITLFSCKSTEKKSQENNSSIHGKWKFVELNNIDKNKLAKYNTHINLTEKNNVGTAYAGCNNISFSYTQTADEISFGKIISTRMYCEDSNEIERAVITTLKATKNFKIEENVLHLITENKETVKLVAE